MSDFTLVASPPDIKKMTAAPSYAHIKVNHHVTSFPSGGGVVRL